MRLGRFILGTVALGAIGTYAYRNASEENKRKVRGYLKKAIDFLPEQVRNYIPKNFRDKLEDTSVSGRAGAAGRATAGGNVGSSQNQGASGY